MRVTAQLCCNTLGCYRLLEVFTCILEAVVAPYDELMYKRCLIGNCSISERFWFACLTETYERVELACVEANHTFTEACTVILRNLSAPASIAENESVRLDRIFKVFYASVSRHRHSLCIFTTVELTLNHTYRHGFCNGEVPMHRQRLLRQRLDS